MTQSRYSKFIDESGTKSLLVPFIKLPKKSSDYYIYYKVGKNRLDTLSYEYYNDPNYGWLIMQANPSLNGLEFDIPDNYIMRIPYPLDKSLTDYADGVEKYKKLYGLN